MAPHIGAVAALHVPATRPDNDRIHKLAGALAVDRSARCPFRGPARFSHCGGGSTPKRPSRTYLLVARRDPQSFWSASVEKTTG